MSAKFEPKKYLKKILNKATGEVTCDIELGMKKHWFRLEYPNGRMFPVALQITDSIAIIECRVFFDKEDTKPASGYIATCEKEIYGSLYIQSAQYIAENEALSAAGFGCQFNDVRQNPYAALVQAEDLPADVMAAATIPATIPDETVTAPAIEKAETPIVVEETIAPADEKAEAKEVDTIFVSSDVPVEPTEAVPSRFTPDMSVDKILADMTPEEAGAVIVDIGTCKGLTLTEVLENRPVSLQWYVNGYNGDNNILRAGARLLLGEPAEEKAA